jgi:hypothetical protein
MINFHPSTLNMKHCSMDHLKEQKFTYNFFLLNLQMEYS